ncbi:MAG: T9SS type B sorting domain-containing protein [Flavobacterium sp.]|nr:T9SS type B sorting domain-containing protein [Flavobacterium sp.]
MKKNLLFLFFTFSFTMQSQCFDCAKNFGGWNGDAVADVKKTIDGIYLIKNSGNFGIFAGIYKFDFNCNLVWKKEIDNFNIYTSKVASDSQGNIYVLITWANAHNAVGPFPITFNGFPTYPGLNLFKFDKNGKLLWNKSLGRDTDYGMRNVFVNNDNVYVTGIFHNSITIDNQITLTNPTTSYLAGPTLLFISKFTLNGNLLDAKYFGNGDQYLSADMDYNGNFYFSRYRDSGSYRHADIDKIDSNLNIVWTKEISNNKTTTQSSFKPTLLHYNPNNNKLYLWSAFYKFANVLGTVYTDPLNTFYITQSLLCEFNVSNGDLERIKQFNNSSTLDIPGMNGNYAGNTGYLTEKDNELYIFSSFTKTMNFSNITITSSQNAGYDKEELVLFKINLNNFNSEFILKSSGTNYYTNGMSTDAAGPILFHGNDLYLTASFQSSPLIINNTVINNNSGNNASDVMLYKYKLDSSTNSGEIIIENTCFNTPTSFKVNGEFDSILWNFDDPNSTTNNIANINNPQHQFTTKGTYNVTAVVHCGTDFQTLKKEITVTDKPIINSISPLYECETASGSGISSSFDTSNINSTLVGNQQNITIEYRNSNGIILSSPLPNPYTNTITGKDIITAKAFFIGNRTCFSETNIEFNTLPRPLKPTTNSPQTFCIQQNATLNSVAISGQNIKWYDALTNGNLLANTTLLQNGITYYASQIINGCESERVPVLINIQNTATPTGNSSQTFCASQNPTLDTMVITGTAIKWHDNSTAGNILPISTPLLDGQTYYASQTLNDCESPTRLAITVALISTLPANNYDELFCDDLNDGTETVDLSSYNSSVISNTTNYNFTYYSSLSGAENETASNKISNFSSYKLALRENKIYVRINSNTPCYAVAELKLTLLSKPKITIEDIVPICDNNTITIDAGAGFDSYLWSNGAMTQTISVTNPGNFSVTVIDNHATISCSSTKAFTVKKSNKATINAIESKDWTDDDNTITVFVTGNGEYEYSIDGENYQDSNVFSGLASGKYTILVRDKNGCGTAKDEVYLLMFPKFFTPNGDGYNDTWKIKFSDIEEGLTVKIYDRYGKLIKMLDNQTDGWNGTFNRAQLPADDYWFIVTRANGTEYKGHFSLKR